MSKSIFFLHISDLHLKSNDNISCVHVKKIVSSFNQFKDTSIEYLILLISGDLSYSGEKYQFSVAKNFLNLLIDTFKESFKSIKDIFVLVVPGNHDVNHQDNKLKIKDLKKSRYNEIQKRENKKLENFYDFSQFYHCFEDDDVYLSQRELAVGDKKICVNLINNAIFSTLDNYKSLLYISPNEIKDTFSADYVITIMHHSPEFYRDDIKSLFEESIVGNSDILFYGHEHNNKYKSSQLEQNKKTFIQSGGALCVNGNWDQGSFDIGILDTTTNVYTFEKLIWDKDSCKYLHENSILHSIGDEHNSIQNSTNAEFLAYLQKRSDFRYFVFPSLVCIQKHKDEQIRRITTYKVFLNYVEDYEKIIVIGATNTGKTTLLVKLFESLIKKYRFVVFCSTEEVVNKSKKKRQDIDKLIKSIFQDIYGTDERIWQDFEQSISSDCVFIFDDFDQVEGIKTNEFFQKISNRFGKIIISTNVTIDLTLNNLVIDMNDDILKLEIEPFVGEKRRELIYRVVESKSDDKDSSSINSIVRQIDVAVKSQVNIIPPEPYYIIQIAEMYMSSIGENIAANSTSIFNKVFEAKITNSLDNAVNIIKKQISVDYMYTLLCRIAYYIHFNKAYPISRSEIDDIVKEYVEEYGKPLVTEDVLGIAKKSGIIMTSSGNSESYRFCNKSVLAYFVAREVLNRYKDTGDTSDFQDLIDKSCINICSDILLFIIFLTDNPRIIKDIIAYVDSVIKENDEWKEFEILENSPNFLSSVKFEKTDLRIINKEEEQKKINDSQEQKEKAIVSEFSIKDLYDWDDSEIGEFNNRLIRMTALLHILSKSLPCFEHLLKKQDKKNLVELMYRLPNSIFMYWADNVKNDYDQIIEEIKLLPYLSNSNDNEKLLELKAKELFSLYSVNLLLNLYYLSVLNGVNESTISYLDDVAFFDYNANLTYKLQNLMMIESNHSSIKFVEKALELLDNSNNNVYNYILKSIVRHGIITRDDSRNHVNKLESKFNFSSRKMLVERVKHKRRKK